MSAYSAVNAGHGHPNILKAFEEQAKKLVITSRGFHTDKLGAFLKKACDVSGFDMALPMNTGAEAVETAIKAARRWGHFEKGVADGEQEIIVCTGNFHGRTSTIISFSSSENSKRGFGPLATGFKAVPFGDADALEKAITPQTVAFLVEPMQGEAGIILPPQGYLNKVREITRRHNVLLIVDEIQTGMGRTGKNFAYMHELSTKNRPDGMCLGKAIGGGMMPVSLFVSTKELMDVFDVGSHGSTWGGNPLACAVGMAAIDAMLQENHAKNSAKLGAYMREKIESLHSPHIEEIRGSGLWLGVQMKNIDAHEVCVKLLDKGILAKETQETTIRFAPPLVITKEQIDEGVAAFAEVLNTF